MSVLNAHTSTPTPRCGWCGSDERIQKEPFYQKALLRRNQLWICQKSYKIHLNTNKNVLHWFCDLYTWNDIFSIRTGVKGQSLIIRVIIFICLCSIKIFKCEQLWAMQFMLCSNREKKICDVLIHQNNHIQLHALESINTRAHNSQMKNLTWILCDGKVFILFCSLFRCMYVHIRAKPEHLLMWLPNQQSGGVSVCVCMVVLCDGYYPLCTVVLYTCDSKFQYGVKCQMHTQHSMTGTLYSDQ